MPKLNLTRRWVRARPGSVLILVIALLVLLALIGTAYLSSTQTERYSSVQNSINTEADLLIAGLQTAVNSEIAGGLYGGSTYRPPQGEMPTYLGGGQSLPTPTGYFGYDSTSVDTSPTANPNPPDLFLAERIPTLPPAPGPPIWGTISWPLFADSSGYSFDSPFNSSPFQVGTAIQKGNLQCVPGSILAGNGTVYPAMAFWVPVGKTFTSPSGLVTPAGSYVPVSGVAGGPMVIMAADADGDGIADAGLFRLPSSPIDGITYYAAMRVIDNNSAINASTAWTSLIDPATSGITEPLSMVVTPVTVNYGFFRSNIGLREMLQQGALNLTTEMNELNAYRFNGTLPTAGASPTFGIKPVADNGTVRSDFGWYSAGDALDQQLARRPGNPGNNGLGIVGVGSTFYWLGQLQSAALAYKFSLTNSNASQSLIEQILASETYNYSGVRSTPYSPSQVQGASPASAGYWFGDLFNFGPSATNPLNNPMMPLRTVLTCDNPVSNAVQSRLGNATSTTIANWNSASSYNFGDCVINAPATVSLNCNPAGDGLTYVCLLANTGGLATAPTPPASILLGTEQYWAVVPWTRQPVKASINTATFEQLWINFCQVMTDSTTASSPGQVKQWNPPMLPTTPVSNAAFQETQLPPFRSSIRDNRNWPISNSSPLNTGNPLNPLTSGTRIQLTAMQQMQLRAALAAINTITMRNATSTVANHQTRSRRIVLQDTAGNPVYDVEVFGTDIQPYIGQVYAYVKDAGGASSANFIAIQLINPYPVPIPVTANWGLATIDRSKTGLIAGQPGLTLTSVLTPAGTQMTPFTIPAATAGVPGIAIIWDGTSPVGGANLMVPPTSALLPVTQLKGLIQAIGKELVILKPRLLSGSPSSETTTLDNFTEAAGGNAQLFDLVPVDQIDLTGADQVWTPTTPANLYYKRGSDPSMTGSASPNSANFSWNFVWPGFYTPYNSYNPTLNPTAKAPPTYTPSSVPTATYPLNQSIVNFATPPSATNPNFTALCGGYAKDTTGQTQAQTYNTIGLQLNNLRLDNTGTILVGFPGPNPVAATGNQFPFGGFARNVDMMQIPYIGAYRIGLHGLLLTATTGFFEMNSVTMDSSLANDSTLQPSLANATTYSASFPSKVVPSTAADATLTPPVTADAVTDPFVEQIGRFCPIGDTSPTAYNNTTVLNSPGLLDLGTDSRYWHYHWAKHLFDYFTVQAPHDDYFPNVDPAPADPNNAAIPAKYPAGLVVPVNNSITNPTNPLFANAVVAGTSEDTVGVEGLININTAPWPVLARLPFVPAGTDKITYTPSSGATTVAANIVDDNVDIAMAIADYRARNGPFKSITDLYNVPAVRLENDQLLATEPGSAQGDFSIQGLPHPAVPPTNGVRFDFDERFLLLNNISNLITTRSDTFTCYVLLQGWRNVGTGNPTLVVQRRIAFLVDRNGVTPSNNQVSSFKIPSN